MSTIETVEAVIVQPVANRDAILSTIADEVASSTQKAYAQSLKGLLAFYEQQGWDFYPQSGDVARDSAMFTERVLSYLRHLADNGRTLSTINKALAAVKNRTSFENPLFYSALHSKPVKAFMEGLARQGKEHSPRKAQAFTLDDLNLIYKSITAHTPRDIRDKALIALGVATALRSSNLGELTLADITPAVAIDGVNVRVRFSKTDQTGQGVFIPVARFSKRRFDPVKALTDWLAVLRSFGYTKETHPKFPLFPVIRGLRGVQESAMRHPSIAITEMLRQRVVEASVASPAQAEAYSSHSLRATFITLSNQAGVAEKDIARVSGHKDMTTLRGYDRTSAEMSAQTAYLNPVKKKSR